MTDAFYFGYALIALSAVLAALEMRQRTEKKRAAGSNPDELRFLKLQLQRRTVATGLIGVVGAAISLASRVPRNGAVVTCYLFGLLIASASILGIAVADLQASRRHRESKQLGDLARSLKKHSPRP